MEMETADWNLALGKRIPGLWTMAVPVEAGPSPQPVAATPAGPRTGAANTVIKTSIVNSGHNI